MNWRKRIRWIVFYPVLLVAGLHTLLTGSPVPMWHVEHLNGPRPVRFTTNSHLVLEDGRQVTLPFIKTIPHDNPLFQAALSNGIEVSTSGEVIGLMWCDRGCGNDPVVWRRLRVNLSGLAGALDPAGIDDSQIHRDTIAFIQEHKFIDLSTPTRSHRKLHLSMWDLMNMRFVHNEFQSSTKRAAESRIGESG